MRFVAHLINNGAVSRIYTISKKKATSQTGKRLGHVPKQDIQIAI